jgi:hypothetical protein
MDNFNKRHTNQLSSDEFELGTWVLAHEMWLDTQIGNKGMLKWSGPFIVHTKVKDKMYTLRELDGTVKRKIYFADQLTIFYYRDDHQTVQSVMCSVLEALHPHLDWRHWVNLCSYDHGLRN